MTLLCNQERRANKISGFLTEILCRLFLQPQSHYHNTEGRGDYNHHENKCLDRHNKCLSCSSEDKLGKPSHYIEDIVVCLSHFPCPKSSCGVNLRRMFLAWLDPMCIPFKHLVQYCKESTKTVTVYPQYGTQTLKE